MIVSKNFDNFNEIEKKIYYMNVQRPVLNRRALFADETENFRIPAEPGINEETTFRFRTYRYNVEKVFLETSLGELFPCKRVRSNTIFDYYETSFLVGKEPFSYHFIAYSGATKVFYNRLGPHRENNDAYDFEVIPGFKTPDWAKGAVMYQIFVDRFCNGDPTNDVLDQEYAYIGQGVEQVKDWERTPHSMDVRSFYGGDLQGVLDKLDYLEKLGVNVIYFNPLFVSPSNHKYDIQDYDYIDPHFGKIIEDEGELLGEGDLDNSHATRYISRVTSAENLEASNEFFAHVVEEIHKRGMKVIIDGVFNHCGSFNKWLDKEGIYRNSKEGYAPGAYWDEKSPYHGFFGFNGGSFPKNNTYEGWWGHDTLPKLNYEGSSKLEEYILRIATKWVSPPYSCDGWRLDVAADLGHSIVYNHEFWREFRRAVKRANPNAVILAENYGDSHDWLRGNEWDTIMNYDGFMEPLTWFLTGLEKHSDSAKPEMYGNSRYFFDGMRHNASRMGSYAASISMNELSNHDHSRFLTRTNRKVGRLHTLGAKAAEEGVNFGIFREAVVVQMTWPGAPTIYYGDEAGLCGWTDPDNRRTYPWGKENQDLIEFHRDIIRIHHENEALMCGSLKELIAEDEILCYGRFTEHNKIVVIVNNSEDEHRLKIPVWELGCQQEYTLEQLMVTTQNDYSTMTLYYDAVGGMLDIGLRAFSSVVLRVLE